MVQKGKDSGVKPPSEFSTAAELKNFNSLALPAESKPGDLGSEDMVRCFGFDKGFKRCSLPGDKKISVESNGKSKMFYFCKHNHSSLYDQTSHKMFYSMVYDATDEYDELYSAAARKVNTNMSDDLILS